MAQSQWSDGWRVEASGRNSLALSAARGMGLLSLGLGIAELAAPGSVTRRLGLGRYRRPAAIGLGVVGSLAMADLLFGWSSGSTGVRERRRLWSDGEAPAPAAQAEIQEPNFTPELETAH